MDQADRYAKTMEEWGAGSDDDRNMQVVIVRQGQPDNCLWEEND